MEAIGAEAKSASRQARRAIDGALTRDRGRLLGLWSKWNAKSGDAALRDAFSAKLQASVAERERRAAALLAAAVDAALTIAWYRLHTDRAADKDLRIRYEDAVRWLRDVSAGRASLPGVATSGTAPTVGMVYVAPATPRLFGRGGPR